MKMTNVQKHDAMLGRKRATIRCSERDGWFPFKEVFNDETGELEMVPCDDVRFVTHLVHTSTGKRYKWNQTTKILKWTVKFQIENDL